MLYCNNSQCSQPFNPVNVQTCRNCGSSNLLSLFHHQYQIIRELGSGGFGRTYEARDIHKFNYPCVIKHLSPLGQKPDDQIISLFNQEAQQLHDFGKHPQIPDLYAFFEHNKQLYLIQEFISGENLLTELKSNGTFDEEKIIHLLKQLLPVLKLLHNHNIIHRDIKPENIICRSTISSEKNLGEIVLIDFGISKKLISESKNQIGTIIGTIGYAPPEQITMGEVSFSSDLYSLGVTCIRLLTGKLYNHSISDVLYDTSTGRWKWRDYIHPEIKISEQLKSILDKLIQRTVKDRYQNADEVLNDLKKIQQLPQTTMNLKYSPRRIQRSNNYREVSEIVLEQAEKKELVRIAKLSVPLLEMRLNNSAISSGSSFMYKQIIDLNKHKSRCYFMTNLHVISQILNWPEFIQKYLNFKADIDLKIVAIWNQQEFLIEQFIIPKNAITKIDGSQADVQHLDFALFHIDIDNTEFLDFFGIAKNSELEIGDTLYAFGYPKGFGFAMSNGIVSQIHEDYQEGKHPSITRGTIQHNILINPGNSGGPTINEFGEIIGISTRGLSISVAVGINFSLKIKDILQSLQNYQSFQLFNTTKYLINLKSVIA
ncbi:protein kinase [Chroococcus sp. FPU101]|uniref:protein kinase domain-containing protein n=1 Tax=Chroococcus sp. FPU101 TaxID=1974212 RepID=UPI001A8E6216|nr:protein kinase [Chroococcus sp. FPU101]GFE67947.1 hypothetical protein CFPU101_05570 [Chroococcus sp. FPU101]